MDDVFALCAFKTPPEGATDALRTILGAGMPANIRVGELREESDFDLGAGLGHLICENVTESQIPLAKEMLQILFEFGLNWMLLDSRNRTPGDIAYERGLTSLYSMFVDAGVRSEIVLQKLLEDSDDSDTETAPALIDTGNQEEAVEGNQKKFLANELKYDDRTLQTDENDGVMMDWESPIMKRSAELITKSNGTVLNIGFGMGIIDNYIQEIGPSKHYIIEAHPQVLSKMKSLGWYDKPNVVVMEGTWKSELPKLLDAGIQFDGIYYDTFSEHYRDMLDLFDFVVGLLSFDGIFSYFNGLGADRQVCYDVYKQVALFNLKDYGLNLELEDIPIDMPEHTWDNIKRSYFNVKTYALPIVTFADQLEEEEGELLDN